MTVSINHDACEYGQWWTIFLATDIKWGIPLKGYMCIGKMILIQWDLEVHYFQANPDGFSDGSDMMK